MKNLIFRFFNFCFLLWTWTLDLARSVCCFAPAKLPDCTAQHNTAAPPHPPRPSFNKSIQKAFSVRGLKSLHSAGLTAPNLLKAA